MGHAPENTMTSFELACQMGSDFVECDVHLSRDQEVVVMHDERVERTTNGAGLIKDLKVSQLKRLDAGSWFSKKFKGEKVPTLMEVLSWIRHKTSTNRYQMGLCIEIKNDPVRYLNLVEKIAELIEKNEMVSRTVVISYDHGAVKRLKNLLPKIATGILYREPLEDPLNQAAAMKADALFPRNTLVTSSLIKKAHQKGFAVASWVINDPIEMEKFIAYGIDAMATNFPDRLNEIL